MRAYNQILLNFLLVQVRCLLNLLKISIFMKYPLSHWFPILLQLMILQCLYLIEILNMVALQFVFILKWSHIIICLFGLALLMFLKKKYLKPGMGLTTWISERRTVLRSWLQHFRAFQLWALFEFLKWELKQQINQRVSLEMERDKGLSRTSGSWQMLYKAQL